MAPVPDSNGRVIADAECTLPRRFNACDWHCFQVLNERPDVRHFGSRPVTEKLRGRESTAAISQLSQPDDSCAGASGAVYRFPVSMLWSKPPQRGLHNAVSPIMGVVLMRHPYEDKISQDLGCTPNVQCSSREVSGSFAGTAALHQVRRAARAQQCSERVRCTPTGPKVIHLQ